LGGRNVRGNAARQKNCKEVGNKVDEQVGVVHDTHPDWKLRRTAGHAWKSVRLLLNPKHLLDAYGMRGCNVARVAPGVLEVEKRLV